LVPDGVDGVVGSLNYNTDILSEDTARRLAQRFLALVASIAAHPERPLRELLTISPDERAQLDAWNATAQPLPAAADLASYVAPGLARDPAKVAVRHAGATTTYGALVARRDQLAAALAARGVGPGDVVAIHLERGPDMIAALLAVAATGATYLPLDPAFPPERLGFMLADSGARAILADADLAALGGDPARVLRLDHGDLPTGPAPTARAAAEDAAYLIYTSGSTGTPKGVRVPHRAVTNFLASMAQRPGLTAADRLCAVTTLSFDIAVLELWLPLAVGAEIVLATRDQATDGHALKALLEDSRATIMQATPATWRMLIEAGWRGGPGVTALCGGEALPAELAEALLERTGALWNMYGPTGPPSGRPAPSSARPGTSRRAPIANTSVWISTTPASRCRQRPGELCTAARRRARLPPTPLTAEKFITAAALGGARPTAPATSRAGAPTARSSTSAAPTSRSRSAATASSSARSRSRSPATLASPRPPSSPAPAPAASSACSRTWSSTAAPPPPPAPSCASTSARPCPTT
jgi:non-ribosomal peptide synthetase component F